jgi:phosphoribosylaminoimidazolecarboxamide formyltransferase/IMP cyclohydrolase
MKIQRALLSVSDKAGLVEFARGLAGLGVELLSTGGTAKALKAAGLKVKDVSEFTGFPEMLDGRVKTLHPKVHAGLLYLRGNAEHEAVMKQHGLAPIDLVCVNLYPFEATVAKSGVTFEDAIENIDIGGPTMLRSAAKNHAFVTVVTDPADYARVLECIAAHQGDTTPDLRRELAFKVFAQQARYDGAIAAYLAGQGAAGAQAAPFICVRDGGETLRYGENPHQNAVFYRDPLPSEACIAHAEILHGKEMSYNNYLDGDAAVEAVRELAGQPGVAIIKHSNPCGYATGQTLAEAFEAAWSGDTVSAFGSVIAVTTPGGYGHGPIDRQPVYRGVDRARFRARRAGLSAGQEQATAHPETAPSAGGGSARPGPSPGERRAAGPGSRPGGVGAMDDAPPPHRSRKRKRRSLNSACVSANTSNPTPSCWCASMRPASSCCWAWAQVSPTAWIHCANSRSRAPRKTSSPSSRRRAPMASPPTPSATRSWASACWCPTPFFPFADNIEHASAAGIRFIVQPGGSKKDEEVIAACDQYGIAMAFTGMRHFRH